MPRKLAAGWDIYDSFELDPIARLYDGGSDLLVELVEHVRSKRPELEAITLRAVRRPERERA